MQTTPLPQALTVTISAERRRQAARARLRRSVLVAASVASLVGATASHADASPAKLLPNVVDGVHYGAKDLRRFAHRPLYSRISDDGKTLISYTKLREYKRALARRGLALPAAGAGRVAHAANFGDPPATVCKDNFLQGTCRDINSGWGVANLQAINCDFWGCTEFLNAISSVRTRANPIVLYDKVGFNLAGYTDSDPARAVTIYGGRQVDLNTLWFPDGGTWNDRADSLYVWW
jgi:hypothetical protein